MFYPRKSVTTIDGDGDSTESFVSNMYTILRDNPNKLIDVNNIAESGVYDSSKSLIFNYISPINCGHEGVFVETIFVLTNVFSRILLDGIHNLDNLYWFISDETNGTYVDVPQSIFNPNTSSSFIKARSYRKCIASVLYETTPSEIALYVDYYKNVSIPPRWMTNNEVYDAYYAIEILRFYNKSLRSFYYENPNNTDFFKFPLIFEDNGDTMSFLDITYHNEPTTNYKRISKRFVKEFLGEYYDTLIFNPDTRVIYEINERAQDYVVNLVQFIKYAYKIAETNNNYQKNIEIEKLYNELINADNRENVNYKFVNITNDSNKVHEIKIRYIPSLDDPTNFIEYPLHRYTILIIESLFLIARYSKPYLNQTELLSSPTGVVDVSNIYMDITTSQVIGSSVHNLKNRYERIPYTVELSVRRLPRNLLMEATSLQLSQITMVNNSLLREAILDVVGNPINMVAPIIVDLEHNR